MLERQLASSIVISWQSPDGIAAQDVRSYHVCLDGKVIITVKGNERTKSLIENVDCNQVIKILILLMFDRLHVLGGEGIVVVIIW